MTDPAALRARLFGQIGELANRYPSTSFEVDVILETLQAFLDAAAEREQGWTPTDDNINALPAPLRRYIHDIETKCDPAGDIRTIAVLRDHLEAFSRLSAERQRDLGAAREELAKLKDWRADVTVAFASSWWSAL